jgi:hypothetical protein
MTRRLIAATLGVAALLLTPAPAAALEIAIQDQGADPDVLHAVADDVGARTARFVVRPHRSSDEGRNVTRAGAQLPAIRAARARGLQVQVAIRVKRETTAGDIRWLLQQWDGLVRTVSVGNEPELEGVDACRYASIYRQSYRLIRREFPGIRVGFGELSPGAPLEFLEDVITCRGPPIRAHFLAGHWYQFWSDPLAPPTAEQGVVASWIGLGNLSRVHRFLAKRSTRARLSTPGRRALPVRCTEFTYLTSGRWATTLQQATRLWPRAIAQARRWCEQLVIYGLGPVHDASNWGSATLLDRLGLPTVALHELARALGQRVHPRAPAHRDITATISPDGARKADERPPVAEPAVDVPLEAPVQEEPPVVENPEPPAPAPDPDPVAIVQGTSPQSSTIRPEPSALHA